MPVVGSAGVYEVNGRKYIDVDGLHIKVPWRYGKMSGVTTKGLRTIFELRPGDVIKTCEFTKKIWNGSVYYVLKSIDTD